MSGTRPGCLRTFITRRRTTSRARRSRSSPPNPRREPYLRSPGCAPVRLYLIDFSMGEKTDSLEAKGVDLRLLKEAWTSAHFVLAGLFESEVLVGYRETNSRAEDVISKLAEIEQRGRYT